MKRSYTYLKGLLTLALAAFTGWMWAAEWTTQSGWSINWTGYQTLTSPVLIPTSAPTSFTATFTFSGGNQRIDIDKVELVDPTTGVVIARDVHEGYTGNNHSYNVYTLSDIKSDYAGKTLWLRSSIKCNGEGTSSGNIALSNDVTHTSYTSDEVAKTIGSTDITEVVAINFVGEGTTLDSTSKEYVGFVTADGEQGAEVVLSKWNNMTGSGESGKIYPISGTKTDSTYDLTYTSAGAWHSNDGNATLGLALTHGYLDVSNHDQRYPHITLAGMPNSGYDVAVILSGDGNNFNSVTVNGVTYKGDPETKTTIKGDGTWGTRKGYSTLAEGQNVIYVTEQTAETLEITGNGWGTNNRGSVAAVQVFFRPIPESSVCTYTVGADGGSWDAQPTTESPCEVTIAFAETENQKVDLATILNGVTKLKSLKITGTNGGTITNTDGITAGSIEINTNVTIPSSFATPTTTTIAEGVSVYFTGETTTSNASFPYSGNRHFETIKFTVQQIGSGIENYTIAANEQMLFTYANVRYIENLILDGGLLKTEGNGQAWFGGAANKCLTVKSGIADLTSVTTDNDSSAVLIGYSGNGHTLDIQGGLLDASNTSIVGWEQNSKYSQSGGLVKTKGFRQNGARITEMTLTGGTIELGAGGIPDLGMASATLGAATIRATADATIAEALNVTGAATLQAVDGKMLTVSGTISGDGTIAIGGTGTTKTRADDGTYSDATVNATGTVYIGTNRPKIASIAEGATLQIALTDEEVENGISWNVGETLTTEEANRLTVVGATLGNITITDGVLTASLASNLAASWENGGWSKTPVDGAPITITFSEGYTTCTFTNTEAIELASLTIKGETAGEIVLGEYAVTVSEMTVEPEEVTIPVALFNSFDAQAYTVESGKTLKLKGDADVSKTMTVNGTLVIGGSMNFTAGNYVYNGGKLEVASGVTTFNTGNGRGFQDGCTVKIAKGATLKNGKADAPGYNNVTLDIAGTLEVTDGVRWSLGATSSTTLHEGAVLKGTGENDGDHRYAFDYFAGATITVDGDAKIEGNIGAHNSGTITFDVTSDKTLTIEGAVKAGPLATSGAGTVKLAGANTHANTSIANGSKLVVTHATALGTGGITLDGALTFKDVEIELNNAITQTDPENTTNPTGQILIDNSTVTLNGANGNYKGVITVNAGATLKSVTNNYAPFGNGASIVNNGAIDVTNNGTGDCAISAAISGSGSLTVNAGRLILHGANTYTGETTVNGGTLVVSGACASSVVTVDGTIAGNGTIAGVLKLQGSAVLDVSNGPLTVNDLWFVENNSAGVTVNFAEDATEGTVVLKSSTITNDLLADLSKRAPQGYKCVKADDGVSIVLAVAKVNVTIPAAPANTKWYMGETEVSGTIAVDPNTDVTLTLKADEGYVFADGSTEKEVTVNAGETGAEVETPEVTAATPVAQVGETKYQTLADAIAAGSEVTVIADIVTNGPITINKTVKINLGGKTITATNDESGDGVFHVVAGGDLSLDGEGTVNALGPNDYCMAVWADGGKVTIEGGTYTNVGAFSEEDGAHFDLIYVKNGGSAIINGGTFICETPRWTLNSHNTLKGTISITGGKFYDLNPADIDTDDGVTTWCADGYTAVAGEGEDAGYYVVTEAPADAQAKIGGLYYLTLADALADAAEGDTITLVKDITASEIITIEKAITLDGNGKTLTSTAGRAINVDCAGAVTIQNLTINAGERAINIINQAATVTINGVTATANNVAVMIASSAGAATVSIEDSDLTGLMVVAVYGAGADVDIADSTIVNVDANENEGYGAITVGNTAIGAKVDVTNTTITVMDDSKKAYNFIPGSATITGVDEVGCIVAMIGEAGYDTIEEAAGDVKAGQTIVLVTDVSTTTPLAIAGTLDLNGKTFTGDCLGTVKVNGGMYVTSQGYKMVGPTAEYYQSSDAIFTIVDIQGSITLNAGTLTVVPAVWWTDEDQTLTIDQGATFVIPAGKQMNVLCDVIANGTLTIEGTANLYSADATIKAPEGLNVVTTVAGCEVKYADGKYTVVESIVIPPAIAGNDNIPDETKAAIEAAMETAGVTEITGYSIATTGSGTDATVAEVAAVLEVFDVEPAVGTNGVLTVTYEFGISAMTNEGDIVTIFAGVTGAEYRAGVTVAFYAEGIVELIGTAITTADSTTVSITGISAEDINGKKITVKAIK